ncbi:uncharacterized protein KZ484_000276 [Pholidichthys leucotaenia]
MKEEPEPQEIKEEQEEFWTSHEVEQFILKQEIDIITMTSISEENEHREPEPNSYQLLCLTTAVTDNQGEEGSRHVDSGSAESEELKMKKIHLKTGSHHGDTPHVQKEEEVLQIQQLCNQERNSSLDQVEKYLAQVKEEDEEFCVSQQQEHVGVKQEADTFMVTPPYEDSDNGEMGSNSDQLLSNSSIDTERQVEGVVRNVIPESTKYEDPKPEKRDRSHSKYVENSPKSENQCNPDRDGKSIKYDVNEKALKNKSYMKKHHTVYTGEKPFASEKKCNGTSQLEQYTGKHTGQRPFCCEICGKHFSERTNLTHHIRTHTGDKPYSCETCGKHFSQRTNLTQHIRVHTGIKPYSCETCGKHFTQHSTLTQHMKIHTGDKPYSCETCGKHFSQRKTLTQHIRIHTGDKPYACERCDKHFSQKSALNTHMRIHTGDKPHACEGCGKHFSRRTSLTTHMRIHTGDKSYFQKMWKAFHSV